MFNGGMAERLQEQLSSQSPGGPPQRLAGCPKGLDDFIRCALQWQPKDRMSIAAAKSHPLLEPPGRVLMVRLEKVAGKRGVGTIADANLDPDLLRHLQECPSWNI